MLHQLRIADGSFQIWSDGDKVWEPLFLLDDSAVEHRPSQRGAAMNWFALPGARPFPSPIGLTATLAKARLPQ